MRHRLAWCLLAAPIGLAGACSTTASGPDGATVSTGSSSGITADQACGDLAKARCDKRDACTANLGNKRAFGDAATCLAREKLGCGEGLAAPSTGATPDTVAKCAAAYTMTSCADFLGNNPPAACIVPGPKADGTPCAFGGQCKSTYCNKDKTATCGVCGAAPAPGSSCADTFCARGQECVAATTLCQPFAAANAMCSAELPCQRGLSCTPNAAMPGTGTCLPAVAKAGDPCLDGGKAGCDNSLGLYCGGMKGMRSCQVFKDAADGAACGALGDGTVAVCVGGACFANGMGNACKAYAKDGAACDTTAGPTCLAPARCIVNGAGTKGTCTLPTGATCG